MESRLKQQPMESGGDSSGTVLPAAPFLSKTYDMVDDPATDSVVSWSNFNNSFVIWSVTEFARDLLPKYFKHSNFSSFVRQLNTYGFRKVVPDRWEFANEAFLRGHKHLLKSINRRKSSPMQGQQPRSQAQNPSVLCCVEDGKLWMKEEVEMMKREKNVVMQELVRLRQQQQSTENQLQNVGQRVHVMEQRQKKTMSFLAKAMQNPSFVAQLVKQQTDTDLHISGGNKRRRIPNQSEGNLPQRFMNEAAKAMLRQILSKSSSLIESRFSNGNGFLIGAAPPPSVSDTLVPLSEVLPSSAIRTELQSSPGYQELVDLLFSKGVEDLTSAQGLTLLKKFETPDNSFERVETAHLEHGDAVPGFIDAPFPMASNEIPTDNHVDVMTDDSHKLPVINDEFWEQFLSGSTLGDTDELNSVNLAQQTVHKQGIEQEVDLRRLNNLNNLTEQIGLIASVSKIA